LLESEIKKDEDKITYENYIKNILEKIIIKIKNSVVQQSIQQPLLILILKRYNNKYKTLLKLFTDNNYIDSCLAYFNNKDKQEAKTTYK